MKTNIDSIKNHKSIAMLAPTFVLDFKYPNIIGMLRELTLNKTTEHKLGEHAGTIEYTKDIDFTT